MPKIVTIYQATQVVTNARLWEAGIDTHIFMMTADAMPALLQLEETCFDPTRYSSLLTKTSIAHLIGRGNGFILIHKQEDRLTGYAQITFRRNLAAGRFYSLAVHPDFQGKGVANLLFKSVEQTCKALGAPTVLLEIREDNKALRYRYEKFGYKPYRRVKDYYPDGCAAIKMHRDIP
jgi:ribosomal protein S18 acetylase RimI-like enzyme